jgi:hypothetical protein
MKPEGTLPCSQGPATSPYPEPHESSPNPTTLLSKDPFEYYTTIYALVFQVVSFLQVFRPKFFAHLSFAHARYMTCPPHPPWFDHYNNILWRVRIMMLLIMKFSPSSCHFLSFRFYSLLSTLFPNILNVCVPLSIPLSHRISGLPLSHLPVGVQWSACLTHLSLCFSSIRPQYLISYPLNCVFFHILPSFKQIHSTYVRFDVLTAVKMTMLFWVLTPCRLVGRYLVDS